MFVPMEQKYSALITLTFRLPEDGISPPTPNVPSPTLETTDGTITTDTDTEETKKRKCESL